MAYGHNPAKVPKFKYIRHDDILSIGNFMLMINNHFSLFQLSGYRRAEKVLKTFKTKINVLPISVATRNFLFIRAHF
jgi:hypothetical protein